MRGLLEKSRFPTLSALALMGWLLYRGAIAAEPMIGDEFHHNFDAVLRTHVVDGYVDYSGVSADQRFRVYIEALSQARIGAELPKQEQLAFWINAYNALAIQGILNGGSPSRLVGRYKYFKSQKYSVNGQAISLYDLERKVIIPLGDNRIHFAIVCASVSCPLLRSEAYVATMLEVQLEDQAVAFLNDGSKNSFDPDAGKARLSKIFDWFGNDFAAEAGSVQQYAAKYVRDPAALATLSSKQLKVQYHKYNWGLNGSPPTQ